VLGFGTVIQPSVTLLKKVILYSWRSQIPLRFALPPFDKGGSGGIFGRRDSQIPLNPPLSKGEAAGLPETN